MIRTRLSAALLGLCMLVITTPVFANTEPAPVEPLVRQKASGVNLHIGLSYVPHAEEGFILEESDVRPYTTLRQQLLIPVQLRYHFLDTFSLSASTEPKISFTQTTFQTNDRKTAASSLTTVDNSFALGFDYHFSPNNPWNPAISMSLVSPVNILNSNISGSLISDPVVLSAALNYSTIPGVGRERLSLSLGVGFYVNDRIRFHATTRHETPINDVALPSWTGSASVAYALDMHGNNDLSIGIVKRKDGDSTNIGLKLEWNTRWTGR